MLDVSKNAVDQLGVNWPAQLGFADFTEAGRVINPFGNKGTSGQGMTITETAGTGFLETATWAAPHFGPVVFGILNSKVSLDFLKTQTDTKYLARPKILTLSNETAEIKIVSDEAIGLNSSASGTGSSGTTQTITVERAETGVSLRITPQVDLEANEITMFLNPTVSEASTSLTTLTAGIYNSSSSQSFTFRNPETRTTKATVRVKDGETVVLGGMIVNQTTTTVKKIPILGDIPIIGKAFKHTETTPGKERELLVFITPRIIKDSGSLGNEKATSPIQQAKKLMLPAREQSTVSVISRQASISNYLNTLDK
jgi:type II secretory pathway component GspD/PulD (secretin)